MLSQILSDYPLFPYRREIERAFHAGEVTSIADSPAGARCEFCAQSLHRAALLQTASSDLAVKQIGIEQAAVSESLVRTPDEQCLMQPFATPTHNYVIYENTTAQVIVGVLRYPRQDPPEDSVAGNETGIPDQKTDHQ